MDCNACMHNMKSSSIGNCYLCYDAEHILLIENFEYYVKIHAKHCHQVYICRPTEVHVVYQHVLQYIDEADLDVEQAIQVDKHQKRNP